MNPLYLTVLLPLSTLATTATAYTANCRDLTGKISYNMSRPDGGAPTNPLEHWTINGEKIFISTDMHSGDRQTALAFQAFDYDSIELLEVKTVGQPSVNAVEYRAYTVNAKVWVGDQEFLESALRFEGKLYCFSRAWMGKPIP